MGILSRSSDLVYTFRFLKLLVTPWEKMGAYEQGLIDKNGKRTDVKVVTSEQKSVYNTFHKLVFNLKRLLAKVPGGSTKFASYAAALFLLKEQFDISDKSIKKIMDEVGVDIDSLLHEETSWYVTEDGAIQQGIYKVNDVKIINTNYEPIVNKYDRVRVNEDCYPVGFVLDIPIFEVTHINTNKKIYVSSGELQR